ncbi:YjbF family lipoprotein (plasmid) [Sulfitobacter sp. W027]|uniref:YjbF family lipoprotein n=1 Tax=Sulfitobacter sp. W027 TaxID=2867025 RepID=UPI0021A8845E|nr:YjbF family lipoprotein [Sulfitobacter sp. W027]UWR35713.1 YjbF family lipoprotein [Sulfitobacter sp. W027]
MKRKFIAALSILALTAACGARQGEQQVLGSVLEGIKGLSAPAAPPVTAEQIRQKLTPEVRAQLGNGPFMVAQLGEGDRTSLLLQAGRNRDVVTYVTPDGISVNLRQGVLISTRGLGFDLMSANVSEVLASLRQGGSAVRIHRYLDGEDQIVIKSFICDYVGNINITESCYGNDQTFENRYRMSAGRVVVSRQWIGPQIGYISLEPA